MEEGKNFFFLFNKILENIKKFQSQEKILQNKLYRNGSRISLNSNIEAKKLIKENFHINKIFEIKSINLKSIIYVFLDKSKEVLNTNNYSILKIYYYDEGKINKNNKFYSKDYLEKKNIDINLASSFIHFKRINNIDFKKFNSCNTYI